MSYKCQTNKQPCHFSFQNKLIEINGDLIKWADFSRFLKKVIAIAGLFNIRKYFNMQNTRPKRKIFVHRLTILYKQTAHEYFMTH